MKKILYLLTALLMMSLPGKVLLAADSILNIKFGGSPSYDNGAAIDNVAGQYWNSFSATDQSTWAPLFSPGMTPNGVSIKYDMTGTTGLDASGTSFPDLGIDTALMRGFVSTDASNSGVINIKGLTSGIYDLYLYSQVDKNLTSNLNFSANGVTGSLTNNGSMTQLTQNQNWLVRTVTVGAAGTLDIALSTNSQLNGLQLSPVPEPGSLILLGVGGSLFMYLRKRTRTESDSMIAG